MHNNGVHRQRTLAALLGLLLVACGPRQSAAPTEVPVTTMLPESRIAEVAVYDDRLEPPELLLQAGESVRLRVSNRTRAQCLFFVADFISNLRAGPTNVVEMGFVVPGAAGLRAQQATGTMGCQNDRLRVGRVIVQSRPS